jgi:hypothetical protein
MLKIKENSIELSGEINYRNLLKYIDGNNIIELNLKTDFLNDKDTEKLLKELSKNYKYKQVKILVEKVND